MSANTETVTRFVEIWSKNDVPSIMAFFTDDCVYHNIPVDPVEGTAAIEQTIQGFAGMAEAIEWDLLEIAETADGRVFTERVDKFKIGAMGGASRGRHLRAARGEICAWRDYFDMNQFTSQMPGS